MSLLYLLGLTCLSGTFHAGNGEVNVALHAFAEQSSTEDHAGAYLAVNGDLDPLGTLGSCTHTKESKDPWWRVDLLETYSISIVRITNRMDCCSNRIKGAKVRIGNSLENNGTSNRLCGTVNSGAALMSFSCHGFTGRYVIISIPGDNKILSLCEVEVFGSRLPPLEGAENLALRGSAQQSSVYDAAGAKLAIDGKTANHWKNNSCSHTMSRTDSWWRVDLHEVYAVSVIRITSRIDCCPKRLLGAVIYVSPDENVSLKSTCAKIQTVSGTTFTFSCEGLSGRYVIVMLWGPKKILTLCEVEVFGSKVLLQEGAAPNVALSGTAVQSSTDQEAGPERAIDGNRNNMFQQGFCTLTRNTTDPWWRVDLQSIYDVVEIKLINRGTCFASGLMGAEIRIGNSLVVNGNYNRRCAVVESLSDAETSFNCTGLTGRYVNIILHGRHKTVSLCEVEVHGWKVGKTIKRSEP